MSHAISPFTIAVPERDLHDLKQRLALTRLPEPATVDGWQQGPPVDVLRSMIEHWRERYDWRGVEARLNGYPGFRTEFDGPGGSLGIHFLHIRSRHEHALPMVMTHGWPGSVTEFFDVIGPLTDPEAHGGTANDAFHLVLPTLPGYGFSDKPTANGWSAERIAQTWDQLMKRLGYPRYVAQGGDWGALVTQFMGVQAPAGLAAIHVNVALVVPDMNDLTAFEQQALAGMQYYQDVDSGYNKLQATRPQTIGYALADSPVGQLAWILEKFHNWTDCDGDPIELLGKDKILDDVTLYWLTNTGASSARLYWESAAALNFDPVHVPTGISVFPKEIFLTSRRWAEARFSKLIHFNTLSKGGHFAALEQPELFVTELRACFAGLR